MAAQSISEIILIPRKEPYSVFSIVLQQGFFVRARMGASLKSFLCDQFGISSRYLSNRIKTFFLNGKPVDDIETAIITDGSTLAMSAAMPGLVGAAFRSGGVLSPFRSSISFKNEDPGTVRAKNGSVRLKLFNLLVPEMGPVFLERGIWVDTCVLDALFKTREVDFQNAFRAVILDGARIGTDFSRMLDRDKGGPGFIYVRILPE